MAEIKTLKQGETQVLPRTVAEAVNTDSGLSVQAELDALKESTPDVSAQINTHNVAEDAHTNRFANYLPLSGGTMTGNLVIGNEEMFNGGDNNTISFSKTPLLKITANGRGENTNDQSIMIGYDTNDYPGYINIFRSGSFSKCSVSIRGDQVFLDGKEGGVFLPSDYTPSTDKSVVNKKYVDDQIAAIPTPDVSAQIEAHNVSETAHANMHWLTADDEMLSSITPDGTIDADTLEGHPASYFATKTELSDYVLKSELSTLVPAPDLSNYYTKTEVDTKITQIQQLIDQAAALVDQINGEVI